MLPLRIQGATRRMAKDQKEYVTLSIRDEMVNGVQVMTSAWEPTPQELQDLEKGGMLFATFLAGQDKLLPAVLRPAREGELELLKEGGSVRLYIPGDKFPPVCIGVTEPGKQYEVPEEPLAAIAVQRPFTGAD